MSEQIVYSPRWVRAVNRYRRLAATFKNWPAFLAFKWGWKSECPQLHTRGGLVFDVPSGSTFEFKDVFLHEAYRCHEILRRLPEKPVVLDVGANVGFFSLYALDCRPAARCLSFEPLAANYKILVQQRALNSLARWEIFPKAVVGKERTVRISSQKQGMIDAGATIAAESENAEGEEVEACSLASIFASQSIDCCDWLKLDCEGSEYEIFETCPDVLLRKISFISAELHEVDSISRNPRALCAQLEQRGFRVLLADDAVIHALR